MFSVHKLQQTLPRLYGWLPRMLSPGRALPPLHAYFEVTYRCNLRCDMCHFLELIEETETGRRWGEEISPDQIKRAIDDLPRFTVITFTGGEAFLKPGFMDVLRYAARRNKVHVITNGTALTPDLCAELIQLRPKHWFAPGLFYVGVSLEGMQTTHDRVAQIPGSFEKTRRGLQELVRRRNGKRFPLVHLTCVIKKENVRERELVSLYEMADALGVNVCNFVLNNPAVYKHAKGFASEVDLRQAAPPVESIDPELLRGQLARLLEAGREGACAVRFSPNGVTPEEIVRYYSGQSDYRNYVCRAAWSKVGVSAYGDVFICPHQKLGELDEHNGGVPWNMPVIGAFRRRMKAQKIFPGCLGCCQSEFTGQRKKNH